MMQILQNVTADTRTFIGAVIVGLSAIVVLILKYGNKPEEDVEMYGRFDMLSASDRKRK